MKKFPVEFGVPIQLEHIKTHKYLSFHSDQNKYVFSENQGCIYFLYNRIYKH